MRPLLILLLVVLVFTGCSTSRYSMTHDKGPVGDFDVSRVPDAVPKWEPISPKGNATPYTVRGEEYHLLRSAKGYREEGLGSWYGLKFHGELTSNGEVYNMYSMSAAHKTLPLPAYLKVTNLENQKTVVVRVNDRGPFHGDRLIDLSYAAAKKLGYHKQGTAKLLLESIVVPKLTGTVAGANQATEDRLSYFIQIAALSNPDAAAKLVERIHLMALGYEAFLGKAMGAEVYRVRLGPIDDLSVAEKLQKQLAAKKVGSPIIISRPILAKES